MNGLARAARYSSTGVRVAVVAVVILVAAALVLLRPSATIASSPVLSVLSGGVLVAPADAPSRAGQDGEPVNAGATVQTEAPNGRAVLTFREGSTVELEPGTAITIVEVSLGTRGEIAVRLGQTRGRSWAHVQPLLSPSSRFHVATPSATAVARGTSFEIEVEAAGPSGATVTTVSVFEGQVDLVAAGAVEPVSASRAARVVQGRAPEASKELGLPSVCMRMKLTSTALMTVTDPYERSTGRTARGTVSQIPRAVVNDPQELTQLVDILSPRAGEWEVGIAPRGDGGDFQLIVEGVAEAKAARTRAVLTGSIQRGQLIVAPMRIGDDGQVSFGPLQQNARTRAKIADVGFTTTAPLPQAKLFAPAVERPGLCAGR